MSTNRKWDWEIGNYSNTWNWNFKEIWSYRHLLLGLIKRDFVLNYQQTLLGPIWSLLQPVFTLITYVIVFSKLVGIPIGTIPPALFYLSGIVLWNFFSDSLNGTSSTFKDHFYLFSKVYFPRIIMPFSIVCTHFLRCLLQFALLFILMIYYWLFQNLELHFSLNMLGALLSIFFVGASGLGIGLLVSLLTAKYRDLANIVSLGTRLLMFITPVIYPLASARSGLRWIVELNPLTAFFELFRFSLLGEGSVSYISLMVSICLTICILMIAVIVFNNKSNNLLDIA